MSILGLALIAIGFIIGLIYGIQLLILAFRTSILWGLGSMLVPFVGIIFIIKYWDEAKKPFLRSLIAIPFYIAGGLILQAAAPVAN